MRSGHQEGKPSWDWVGSAVPDLCLDWTDPAVRFHVLGTPIRATLKLLEQDRLTPLLDLLRALRQVDPPEPGPWSPGWCAELPRDEGERNLLRHIEHFPHDSPGKVSKYVSTLRSMEKLARPWLETCDSPAQRLLAVGVANVLALGLEILGIEAGDDDHQGAPITWST